MIKLIFFFFKFGANQIMTYDIFFNLLNQSLPFTDQYNTGPPNVGLFLIKQYMKLIKEDRPNYELLLSIAPLNKIFRLFHSKFNNLFQI